MFISKIDNLISTLLANKILISLLLQCVRLQNSKGNVTTLFIFRHDSIFCIRKTEVVEEIFHLWATLPVNKAWIQNYFNWFEEMYMLLWNGIINLKFYYIVFVVFYGRYIKECSWIINKATNIHFISLLVLSYLSTYTALSQNLE